jgi:hypothetical protein
VNTRQLNASFSYPGTGVTDNELRALNRISLFNPAFDEGAITNFEKLSALTNVAASLQDRSRSYLDANCAQCHQPGGTGPTFDARYDTPLTNQNLINFPASVSLGYDNARIIAPEDVWRSTLYDRINSVNGSNGTAIQMPPLARNSIDIDAVAVFGAWINSLPGIPAVAPPVITPNGGNFVGPVSVTVTPPDTNAQIYYTLDGSIPTTNSFQYTGLINIAPGATTLSANAFEATHVNSVTVQALFVVVQAPSFSGPNFTNQTFQFQITGATGNTYVLQATSDLVHWVPVSTNVAASSSFTLSDTNAANFRVRFYRVVQQ